MLLLLRVHDRLCIAAIRLLLRLALAVDDHRRRLPRGVKRRRGALRRLYSRWLLHHGLAPPPTWPGRRRPWNRTAAHLEEKVVRLHVEQPHLGAGQLHFLARRVLGFEAARETFRRILIRRQDLVTTFQQARRRRPRRISISHPLEIWGADLTLVFVLGLLPVWVLGVIDYRGSRLVAFEPLPWPTSAAIARSLNAAFDRHGVPDRLLTDRGPVLRAPPAAELLAARGVRNALTLPAHPWTNGRIERVFRLFTPPHDVEPGGAVVPVRERRRLGQEGAALGGDGALHDLRAASPPADAVVVTDRCSTAATYRRKRAHSPHRAEARGTIPTSRRQHPGSPSQGSASRHAVRTPETIAESGIAAGW